MIDDSHRYGLSRHATVESEDIRLAAHTADYLKVMLGLFFLSPFKRLLLYSYTYYTIGIPVQMFQS